MLRDEISAAHVAAHDLRRPAQGGRGSAVRAVAPARPWVNDARRGAGSHDRSCERALTHGSILWERTNKTRLPAVGPHKVLRTHVSGQTVVVQTQGEVLPWSARHLLLGATACLASPAVWPSLSRPMTRR